MSGLCTWFQPSRYREFLAVTCVAAVALGGTTGCQSIPRLRNPSGLAWNAAPVPAVSGDPDKSLLTAVPEFDQPVESRAVASATATAAVEKPATEKPATEKASSEKVVVAAATAAGITSGQVDTASTADRPTTATTVPTAPTLQTATTVLSDTTRSAGTDPVVPTGSVQQGPATAGQVSAGSSPAPAVSSTSASAGTPSAAVAEPTVASAQSAPAPEAKSAAPAPSTTQLAKADGLSKTDSGPAASGKPDPVVNQAVVADAAAKAAIPQKLPAYSERRPEAFAWRRTGRTAGGRPFEISLTGEKGFRTLFIGSAVGNDPVSMKLMDRLARHLHENGLILGGFEVAVIHTLNPDGAASGQPTNALGRYVNGRFPLKPEQKPAAATPEVDFRLGCIRSFRPQRVVHVRTIGDSAGVIACNERCLETAEQIAEALKFSRLSIPAQTREGSLEHCLSAQADLDVITLALPRGEKADGDPWTLYGDTLLNLLQPRSIGGREANRGLPKGGAEKP